MKKRIVSGLLGIFFVITAAAFEVRSQNGPTPITIGESWRIHSKRLNEEREVRVFFPASYANSKRPYPVIYTLDGELTGSVVANSVQFMADSSSIPQMPDAIVVAIVNSDRNRDMPVPNAYGKNGESNFLAFLTHELIPTVEQKYRTHPLRILVGHSQGGLFAIYALAEMPSAFQWYLSMDAPVTGFPEVTPMVEKARKEITKNPNYHGRLVSIEKLYGWRKEWTAFIKDAPKGFYAKRVAINDETHETLVYKGVYEGLKLLFHDYTPTTNKDEHGIFTLPTLELMFKERSQDYGYQVDIPKELLLTAAAQDTAMRYGAEAIELIKRAVALYGETTETKRLMAEAEQAAKSGRDPRLAEWANLPAPDAVKMKPFLGTWHMTMDRGTESMLFEVHDGVIRTQCTVVPIGGNPFQVDVQFVRVSEDGTLQWGLRNGRGAGIILRTMKLIDENTLQGTTEPVGIEQAPPPHTVTYKRKS